MKTNLSKLEYPSALWRSVAVLCAMALLCSGPLEPLAQAAQETERANYWKSRRHHRQGQSPYAINDSQSINGEIPVREDSYFQQIQHFSLDQRSLQNFSPVNKSGFITHSFQPFSGGYLAQPYSANGIPLIIHFQEAHGNTAGQKNLAALLSTLPTVFRWEKGRALWVCVEGATGPLSTDWFRSLPNRDALAKTFLRAGWMTGEEYLAVTSDSLQVKLIGVEDPHIYKLNSIAQSETKAARAQMIILIRAYSSLIEKLQTAIFPPALCRLKSMMGRFESGTLEMTEYLRYLDTFGPHVWSRDSYPSMAQFIRTLKENRYIGNAIKGSQESHSPKTGDMADPQTAIWVTQRMQEIASMNPDMVRTDIKRLETQLIQKTLAPLPQGEREESEEVLRIQEWIRLNERLWSLNLSTEDWQNLQTLNQKMEWSSFFKMTSRLSSKFHIKPLPPEFEKKIRGLNQEDERLFDFYHLAQERDRVMAQRAAALARREGSGIVALVTGGFHSEGIRRWLRWEPAHYMEMTPRLTNSPTPFTLRNSSRFSSDYLRVPLVALTLAFTSLHHPEQHQPGDLLPNSRSLGYGEVAEADGARWFAGVTSTKEGRIPFLLGGTMESPTLIEGFEDILALQKTRLARHHARDSLDDAIATILSDRPKATALYHRFAVWENKVKHSARALWKIIRDFMPENIHFRSSLVDNPFTRIFFAGALPFYFISPPRTSAPGGGSSDDNSPENLLNQLLKQIKEKNYTEAEKIHRRLQAVDLDDHWSGVLFNKLSEINPGELKDKLSAQFWGCLLNGHFTILFENFQSFLHAQYKEADEILKTKNQRILKIHLKNAEVPLSIFTMNAQSTDTIGGAPHARKAGEVNSREIQLMSDLSTWGSICGEMRKLADHPNWGPSEIKAVETLLDAEKKWLQTRIRDLNHPLLEINPSMAIWHPDEIFIPSIHGELRKIHPQTNKAIPLRNIWESRRALVRERALGVLTDISGETIFSQGPHAGSTPSIEAGADEAIKQVMVGNGILRVNHPWPQTKELFENTLAQRLSQNTASGPRKVWRLNLAELKRPMEESFSLTKRLKEVFLNFPYAGHNTMVIDLAEFEELAVKHPAALAEAVKSLRNKEDEMGIAGPYRTSFILQASMGSQNPLSTHITSPVAEITIQDSSDLVIRILGDKVRSLENDGIRCPEPFIAQLETTIHNGDLDLSTAESILERAGARARSRRPAGRPVDITQVDLDEEMKGLPPFDQLSLWRQAGIAVHSLSEAAREELERNLDQLRRMSPDNDEYPALEGFIRHLLGLRFLWRKEAKTGGRDRRLDRTPMELAELRGQWNKKKTDFRDALDLAITGQTKIKEELEQIYLIHDLEQEGNPHPDPADIAFLQGPPSTGKTTIGRALAKAMGRKFVEINAGGTVDAKRFKGIQRTFVGSQPSEITRLLEEAGTEDILILIDEIDKMSQEALDALTDFLDKRQAYHDTYLGSHLRFKRPGVRIIVTGNIVNPDFPDHLLSRLKVINTRQYTDKELTAIGLDHVFPETLQKTGYAGNCVTVPDPPSVIRTLVTEYSPTNDVRDLQKNLLDVMQAAFHEWLMGTLTDRDKSPVRVDADFVRRVLGVAQREDIGVPSQNIVGQVNGLEAGTTRGRVRPIQAYYRNLQDDEEDELIVTGHMGPTMRDSAQKAHLLVQEALGEDGTSHGRTHFHITGEVSKDGPSAGLPFAAALYSERTGYPVKAQVAMTGDLSPTGTAQPIGGLDKKLPAALEAGVQTVFLPAANEDALYAVLMDNENLRQLRFYLVHDLRQVLNQSLVWPDGVARFDVPDAVEYTFIPPTNAVAWPQKTGNQNKDGGNESSPDEPSKATTERMPSREQTQSDQLAYSTSETELINRLKYLLASPTSENAQTVLAVLHMMASRRDPRLGSILSSLPGWQNLLSAGADVQQLQTMGVLLSRNREGVLSANLERVKNAITRNAALGNFSQGTLAANIKTFRDLLENQITSVRNIQSRWPRGAGSESTLDFLKHFESFLSRISAQIPTSKANTYTEGDGNKFRALITQYAKFLNNSLEDFPDKEFPLIVSGTDSTQNGALLDWIATQQSHRPSSQVFIAAQSAYAENNIRSYIRGGHLIDATATNSQTHPPQWEEEAFRPAAEEMARRLTTTGFRSGMFYSPHPDISIRFLKYLSEYFQKQSPISEQRARRIISIKFPDAVEDADELLFHLRRILFAARAVGDVVLAVDLEEFSRHFKDNQKKHIAFLLDVATTSVGPLGHLPQLPVLFYGKEESHFSLADNSPQYDERVRPFSVLPETAGTYLSHWLIDQLSIRMGVSIPIENEATTVLENILTKDSDLDLPMLIKGLVSLCYDHRDGPSITLTEMDDAVRKSLILENEPRNIAEYRTAAQRIPDRFARRRVLVEISRLARMRTGKKDYQILSEWVETVLAWPWREKPLPLVTPEEIPQRSRDAMKKLDEKIYGMTKAKNAIIRAYELYLHQLSLGKEPQMPIIALFGPPGTSKSLFAATVGEIFVLPSEVLACSGVDDPRHWTGFRRIYMASEPGAVVKAFRKLKTTLAVLIFDEIDKRVVTGHFGDPLNALTRFFDPAHRQINDEYLEEILTTKKTMLVITGNRKHTVPEHLLKRMLVIEIDEPTREEKIGMGIDILVPRLLKSKGFVHSDGTPTSTAPVTIENSLALMTRLVDAHMRVNDDAREIEKKINQVMDLAFSDYVETGISVKVTADSLVKYLGPPLNAQQRKADPESTPEVGRIKIPVQDSALLTIHAVAGPAEKWDLQLPKTLVPEGEKPSPLVDAAHLAWNLAQSFVNHLYADTPKKRVYLHQDSGMAQLDQPGFDFGGLGITAALTSAMIGAPLPGNVMLGGEVDLKGNVVPLTPDLQATLDRKILRSVGEGARTFYLPAGESTRRPLATVMRRHPFLQGIIIEGKKAELTLAEDPGPLDPSDSRTGTYQQRQEAASWNRFLEGLPKKAESAGFSVETTEMSLEEHLGIKSASRQTGVVKSYKITGTEKALLAFIEQESELRSFFTKLNPMDELNSHPKTKTAPPRFVLVNKVDEALNDLFKNTPIPPPAEGPVNPQKSILRNWVVTLGATALLAHLAQNPSDADPLPTVSPQQTVAALQILGNGQKPESPVGRLAHHLSGSDNPPTIPSQLKESVFHQMENFSPPSEGNDISVEEWRTAWEVVSRSIQRQPRPSRRRSTDSNDTRSETFYRHLQEGIQKTPPGRKSIVIDWGMVISRPEEIIKFLNNLSSDQKDVPVIFFLDSEGKSIKMKEELLASGLSRWSSHIQFIDKNALIEAQALSEEGQIEIKKVDSLIQDTLAKQGKMTAPLAQIVADPINARRYLGEVIRLLMDVEEVVLVGNPAVTLVKTLGHDPTQAIKTPTLSYDPSKRTLRFQPQALPTGALNHSTQTLLLIDNQA